MHLVIVGNGKMGRAVAELAKERGHVVHAIIGREENAGGAALTG
jgi:Trk K+ transport system NAD-binding subunit